MDIHPSLRTDEMLWDWDRVFEYLVRMCNRHGGYYKLSIEEGSRFKEGDVGEGWGEYNLRRNIFPEYRGKYPGYEFGIMGKRKYIWCKKRESRMKKARY